MDYEKKYKEALERARALRNEAIEKEYVVDYIKDYETIFPELAESEDERMRKEIVSIVKAYRENCIDEGTHRFDDCLSWLEKQKESLHIPETCKENADSFTDIKNRNIRGCIGMALADVPESRFWAYGVTLKECLAYLEKHKEQKPAEWSEEDEEMLEYIIGDVNDAKQLYTTQEAKDMADKEIAWLKSLRPRWRPSEEQMEAFRSYIKDFQEKAEAAVGDWNNFDVMIRLYEQLKKL